MEKKLSKYALLCGSAPDGMMQKKIDSMYESLSEENGGRFAENEIMIFPNGIDEASLAYVLNNLRMGGIEQVLLYVCTVTPVEDREKTVWLGGNEVRKEIFEKPATLAGVLTKNNFFVQVIYDSDREFMSGEDYFLDAAVSPEFLCGKVAI